ncbi:MAG: hypothetical protein A4E28_01777 [Methanocella sp. PtaU1.Bin125]|nr:MAG: hypothetical protein A4E28_01777 [Methanocella sp. PtaU1.Bin125]
MRKLYLIAIIIIVLAGLSAGAYTFLFSGDSGPTRLDNPHFTVMSVSSQPFFEGENVVVQATVVNDEPPQEVAIPTTTELTITPAPDDASSAITVTAVPTTIVQTISASGSHVVTARLSGGDDVNVTREAYVTLASDKSKELSFDFGQVPAGMYLVSVTAPSYNDSTAYLSVRVSPAPAFGDWTGIGDVAFMFVNLRYDSVDLIVRNDGQRTVVFSDSQYTILVNESEDSGTVLLVPGQTMVSPGKTVIINATIPAAGSYYLDYFAIKAPGRAAPVKVPVQTMISPAN